MEEKLRSISSGIAGLLSAILAFALHIVFDINLLPLVGKIVASTYVAGILSSAIAYTFIVIVVGIMLFFLSKRALYIYSISSAWLLLVLIMLVGTSG